VPLTDTCDVGSHLQTSAVVCKLPDAVESKINNFLANGIVAPSKVICSIFLAGDELLRMEQLAIYSSTNFINYGWLKQQHCVSSR
jgi:hypothetical protein